MLLGQLKSNSDGIERIDDDPLQAVFREARHAILLPFGHAVHDNGGAGTPTFQLREEAPPSFQMLSRTGCRVIIQPWAGRATRTNVRGVTSNSFFPLMASLMTNAPFSLRPAM